MLRRWSLVRVQAELGALQASAERAGAALARIRGSSPGLETGARALRGAERAMALTYHLNVTRLLLAAVTIAAVAALATVSL